MINLINGWYIEADSYSYALRRKYTEEEIAEKVKNNSEKTAEEYGELYETFGYYGTTPIAINGFIKHMLRQKVAKEEITTLKGFADELKKLKDEINALIEPLTEELNASEIAKKHKAIKKK